MKKAISILLCLCLALSVFTVVPFAASAAEVTEESVGATSGTTVDCTWALDDNDTLTISGYGAMGDYSSQKLNGTWITTAPWGANIKTVIIRILFCGTARNAVNCQAGAVVIHVSLEYVAS